MNVDKARWFAISVTPRKEKVTAQTLRAKDYEEFLPLYTVRRNWSDRVKAVALPLFPGYVFCRFDPEFRLPILKIPSVNQIVGFGKTPHPVEDAEVDALQRICKTGVQAVPCPYMTVGAKVTILQGPLKGLEGIMMEPKETRLVVSVTLLQRSVSVELDREWISPRRTYTELAKS
jgi:transcription antitermination factor NusG